MCAILHVILFNDSAINASRGREIAIPRRGRERRAESAIVQSFLFSRVSLVVAE